MCNCIISRLKQFELRYHSAPDGALIHEYFCPDRTGVTVESLRVAIDQWRERLKRAKAQDQQGMVYLARSNITRLKKELRIATGNQNQEEGQDGKAD